MRVLITGATGFIGRHLTHHLLHHGHTVIALVREQHAGQPLPPPLAALRPQIDLVYADLRNLTLTRRALQQAAPDAVVHLAAVGVNDPFLSTETALRHNLYGTLNLLKACFETAGLAAPTRLIIGRTPGEQFAMNVYAASKAAAWAFCQMHSRTQGWPIAGATIFQCYGPGQFPHALIPAAFRAALAAEDFPMTTGRQQRDWIYVDDVAAGLAAALSADLPPGDSFDLATGRLTPIAAVARQIYTHVNRGGQPLVGVLPDRPGEVGQPAADVVRSRALLNWQAAVSLDEGLRRLHRLWASEKSDN
jgi:nucleoside-diphosphate-sugar epimerase